MAEPIDPPNTVTLHEIEYIGELQWVFDEYYDSSYKITGRTQEYVLSSKLDSARAMLYEAYPWISDDMRKSIDLLLPKEWCDAYSKIRSTPPEAPK